MSAETADDPVYLQKGWVKRNFGVTGSQARNIAHAFVTQGQLVDALEAGEDLTEYDGIGEKTARAIRTWFEEVYGGEVEADSTLVLDDDGLHTPERLVGFTGTLTVETPTITMRQNWANSGIPERSGIILAYPGNAIKGNRLSEGQIALSAPGFPEKIYAIDDQQTEERESA